MLSTNSIASSSTSFSRSSQVHGEPARRTTASYYQLVLSQDHFASGDITRKMSPRWQLTISWLIIFRSGHHILLPSSETTSAKSLTALAASNKGGELKSKYASVAWVQFALGCLKLYIPDKVFDPYLRAQVETEYHQRLRKTLRQKIDTLGAFEQAFTGENTNIRTDLLEQELLRLGESPSSVSAIYRPSDEGLASSYKQNSIMC